MYFLKIAVCPFSFGHCIVYPSIYGFWLPLWYLQTLHFAHQSYVQDLNNSNTTAVTGDAGTGCPPEHLTSFPVSVVLLNLQFPFVTKCFVDNYSSLVLIFKCIFCRSLFVLFLLTIVLSVVLLLTASDYLFAIFKLSLTRIKRINMYTNGTCRQFLINVCCHH